MFRRFRAVTGCGFVIPLVLRAAVRCSGANNSRSAHVRRMKNNYFSTVAGAYACYRPHYPQELYEFLAGCCRHVRRAWDCATGNGQAGRQGDGERAGQLPPVCEVVVAYIERLTEE